MTPPRRDGQGAHTAARPNARKAQAFLRSWLKSKVKGIHVRTYLRGYTPSQEPSVGYYSFGVWYHFQAHVVLTVICKSGGLMQVR